MALHNMRAVVEISPDTGLTAPTYSEYSRHRASLSPPADNLAQLFRSLLHLGFPSDVDRFALGSRDLVPLQHRVETLNQQLPALLITAQRIGHDVLGKQFELGARFAGFGRRDLLQFGFDAFAQPIRWAACGIAECPVLKRVSAPRVLLFTKGMGVSLFRVQGCSGVGKRGRIRPWGRAPTVRGV